MSTATKTKPSPSFEVTWDDRAGGFRIEVYDERADAWTSLPRATDTDHPLYAGTCAAVTERGPRAQSDHIGPLWLPRGDDDIRPDVERAAVAAAAALSPLSGGEQKALDMLSLLGVAPRKRFSSALRAKHLIDDTGKITPAGKARSSAWKSRKGDRP